MIIMIQSLLVIDVGKYTKYFLNLEHRHFNKKQKTIKSLHVQLSDNSVVKKDNKILKKDFPLSHQ